MSEQRGKYTPEQLRKLAADIVAKQDDKPAAGDTYYVEHDGKQRHLRVLSVTLTHTYVRYLDTGYQTNVPNGLLARWTKLEAIETEAGE